MTELHYQLVARNTLSFETMERMFELMRQNYDFVAHETFLTDLNQKQYVGVLYDTSKVLQGFTTYSINPQNCGTSDYNILFSGDTIVSPEHWGTQELVRGFCHSVGQFIASDTSKKWYWYLLSKGHRTYMYLPLFFENYYPSVNSAPNEAILRDIVNAVSKKMYPKYWLPDLGILRFDSHLGQLNPHLAESTFQKAKKPHIAFFLQRNPKFYEGEELVCLTELSPENAKRMAKEYILKGMEYENNEIL